MYTYVHSQKNISLEILEGACRPPPLPIRPQHVIHCYMMIQNFVSRTNRNQEVKFSKIAFDYFCLKYANKCLTSTILLLNTKLCTTTRNYKKLLYIIYQIILTSELNEMIFSISIMTEFDFNLNVEIPSGFEAFGKLS